MDKRGQRKVLSAIILTLVFIGAFIFVYIVSQNIKGGTTGKIVFSPEISTMVGIEGGEKYGATQTTYTQDISGCQKLTGSNTVYKLTKDLTGALVTPNCFEITGYNTVLDCQGHKISNPSLKASVIVINRTSKVTVRNCTVTSSLTAYEAAKGIYVAGSSYNLIESNNVYNTAFGIHLQKGNNNLIYNNRLERNAKAISFEGSNNIAYRNHVYNNSGVYGWGLSVWAGTDNRFINNNVYGNGYGVIIAFAKNTTISCGKIYSNNNDDIYVYKTSENTTVSGIKLWPHGIFANTDSDLRVFYANGTYSYYENPARARLFVNQGIAPARCYEDCYWVGNSCTPQTTIPFGSVSRNITAMGNILKVELTVKVDIPEEKDYMLPQLLTISDYFPNTYNLTNAGGGYPLEYSRYSKGVSFVLGGIVQKPIKNMVLTYFVDTKGNAPLFDGNWRSSIPNFTGIIYGAQGNKNYALGSCVSNYAFFCDDITGDVYWYDSCGKKLQRKEDCMYTCVGFSRPDYEKKNAAFCSEMPVCYDSDKRDYNQAGFVMYRDLYGNYNLEEDYCYDNATLIEKVCGYWGMPLSEEDIVPCNCSAGRCTDKSILDKALVYYKFAGDTKNQITGAYGVSYGIEFKEQLFDRKAAYFYTSSDYGSSDYVFINENKMPVDYTVSFWFKAPEAWNNQTLFSDNRIGSFTIGIENSKLYLNYAGQKIESTTLINETSWSNVMVVFNSTYFDYDYSPTGVKGRIELYLNNNLEATMYKKPNPLNLKATGTDRVEIGARTKSRSTFKGYIDEFSIFGWSLNPHERSMVYTRAISTGTATIGV